MFISALRFETRTLRPRFLYKFFLITPPACFSRHTSSFVRPLQPLALRGFQRYYAFSFATVFSVVSFCRARPFSHCVPPQNSICLHLCRCEQKNPKHKPRTFLSFHTFLQPLALRDFQRYVAFSFAAVFGNFVLLRRTFLALRFVSELNLPLSPPF